MALFLEQLNFAAGLNFELFVVELLLENRRFGYVTRDSSKILWIDIFCTFTAMSMGVMPALSSKPTKHLVVKKT